MKIHSLSVKVSFIYENCFKTFIVVNKTTSELKSTKFDTKLKYKSNDGGLTKGKTVDKDIGGIDYMLDSLN